ncbi:hypothetical protein KC361_g7051 [Hortaea werneckii]|nr:hypothetical protein KC361_g7051 [Hortaea werneckii]
MDPGTWTDHESTGIESSSGHLYNAIDGNLFITSSDTNLLTFGYFYGDVDASGRACTDGGSTLVLGSRGNVYGPGGQSIFNDPSEESVLVYHYVDTTIGYADGAKRLGINKINFSSGWPVV